MPPGESVLLFEATQEEVLPGSRGLFPAGRRDTTLRETTAWVRRSWHSTSYPLRTVSEPPTSPCPRGLSLWYTDEVSFHISQSINEPEDFVLPSSSRKTGRISCPGKILVQGDQNPDHRVRKINPVLYTKTTRKLCLVILARDYTLPPDKTDLVPVSDRLKGEDFDP